MRDQSHTLKRSVSHVLGYRSALIAKVTIMRHCFHVPQTAETRSSTPLIDPIPVTPTRHWLLYAPHADEC